MHSILQRHLDKLGLTSALGPTTPAQWAALLACLDRSFTQFDSDRQLQERSMTIASAEMADLHRSLAFQNDTLERVVEERTGQLKTALEQAQAINADLEKATTAAEAASRTKSEFLATMSHEIRTPLNGVVGLLDILLGTDLTPDQMRYGMLAKSSATLLTNILGDILDLSKIEAGKLEISPSDFNLQQAVEGIMDVMAQVAAKKKLETICHIEPGIPEIVRADAERLRQVILNLVNNAIKFTERGTIVVRVACESKVADRVVVRFSVTDTGIGIPPERMDRLFRAFSQADASTTRVYGGTGLGLVISKQITALMGGNIGVESEPGRGTTFWFTIPFEVPARRSAVTPPPPPLSPGELRILAVDDSTIQRDTLVSQLTAWGFKADAAGTAEEAVTLLARAAADRSPYHLALIDRDMPGIDGFELVMALRSRQDLGSAARMMMFAPDDVVTPERLRQVGIDGHISKPIRQSRLFDAIMNTLAARQRDSAPVSPVDICARSSRPTPSPAGGAKLRILVAEDNEINQIVIQEVLNRSGHSCEIAADGSQAAQKALRGHYDVVLMDCQMPVMDGFEATKLIRRSEAQDPARNRVPIVALTANAMKGDRERCLEAGMDGYASKPINPEKLQETIDQVLSSRSADNLSARRPAA